MTNIDLILETLEEVMPSSYCDDYLSEQLGITPRQQVNAICNKLSSQGLISRTKSLCPHCKRRKLVSKLAVPPGPSTKERGIEESFRSRVVNNGFPGLRGIPGNLVEKGGRDYKGLSLSSDILLREPEPVEIEHIRTEIIHMCQDLWRSNMKIRRPDTIAKIINTLTENELIPRHQANMMRTLCGLRNVFVWERLALGPNEMAVAGGAWAIVSDWWKEKSPR